jgi:hypothetical protein
MNTIEELKAEIARLNQQVAGLSYATSIIRAECAQLVEESMHNYTLKAGITKEMLLSRIRNGK